MQRSVALRIWEAALDLGPGGVDVCRERLAEKLLPVPLALDRRRRASLPSVKEMDTTFPP